MISTVCAFIMMALDAASLNSFLMSQTTDDHFSVRDFSWANERKKKSTNTKMGRNNNTKFYVKCTVKRFQLPSFAFPPF